MIGDSNCQETEQVIPKKIDITKDGKVVYRKLESEVNETEGKCQRNGNE